MLSSRTLSMTPGVQESRQDHIKDDPKNQPVEDKYSMLSNLRNQAQNLPRNEHSSTSYFITGLFQTGMFACA